MKTKLIIILILFTYNIYGQRISDSETNVHQYIGFAAGFTTGNGISYRYLQNEFGAQVNLFGGYERNVQANFNIGGTLLYRIDEAENTNLYLYYSNCIRYNNDMQHLNTFSGQILSEKTLTWNTGIGFNVETNSTRRIVFNFMLGYGAYDSFKIITLTGEVGIHYKFK